MKKQSSSDLKHFSGSELELLKMHMDTMKNQLNIKLLHSLLDQKLATRRFFNKDLDMGTLRSAMVTKMSDMKMSYKNGLIARARVKKQLLEDYNGKKCKMRKCIRHIRALVEKERTKIWKKYTDKIQHYKSVQGKSSYEIKSKSVPIEPSTPPESMREIY